MSLQYIHCTWIGVKTKQNNQVGIMNLMSHRTLRAWCWVVKNQNSSPGTPDLIMHVTCELPSDLGSYDAAHDFQTGRKCHYTGKKTSNFVFVCVCVFFYRSLSKSYRAKCVQLKIRTELPYWKISYKKERKPKPSQFSKIFNVKK